MIWFAWKQRKKSAEMLWEMNNVNGDCTPPKTMVYKWVERFGQGWDSVHDEPHAGRPSTSSTPTNIDHVRGTESISPTGHSPVGGELGRSTVHHTVSNDLNMTHIVACWVPYLSMDEQHHNCIRVYRQLLDACRIDDSYLDRVVTVMKAGSHATRQNKRRPHSRWAPGEATPVEVKIVQSAGKRKSSVFWDSCGNLLIDWLPQG